MYYSDLKQKFEAHANSAQAEQMSAYLKHQFAFYGIKQPERKALQKEFWKEHGLPEIERLPEIIHALFTEDQREYIYFAIEMMEKMVRQLNIEHLQFIEDLVQNRSWWDSVDGLSTRVVGEILKTKPQEAKVWAGKWISSSNIWLNRVSILFQLKYKEKTDLDLLKLLISKTRLSNEFFIQKAIGWVLREYSKTDSQWVLSFIKENELKPLSKREAVKWLNKNRS